MLVEVAAEAEALPFTCEGDAVPPIRAGSNEVVLLDGRVAEVVVESIEVVDVLDAAEEVVVVLVISDVVDVISIEICEGAAVASAVVPPAADSVSTATFGQSSSTAVFLKNIPISVLGKAVMPLHSSLSNFVMSWRPATHCAEQVAPW